MIQLALDTTGDLARANGALTLVGTSGKVTADMAAQKLRIRLGLFLGEYVLDTNVGVPWIQQLLGKVPQAVAEGVLRQCILTCPGIARLTAFDLTVGVDRQGSLSFSCVTVTGDVVTITDFRPTGVQ